MRRLLTLTAAAALGAAIIGIVIYGRMHAGVLTHQAVKPISEASRKPAPMIAGPTLAGPRVDLTRYAGKPVVLNFFASWCLPCRAEAPQITRVAKQFGSRVQVLAVANDDSRSGASRFVQKYGWTWPIVWDHSLTIADRYNLLGQPDTFVIDQHGRIAWAHQGKVTSSTLGEVLQALLRA